MNHEALMEKLAQLRQAEEALRRREPERFDGILRILAEADLIGICDDDPRGGERYAPIVGTLLPRLADGMAAPAVQALVFEEMAWWFNTPPGGSVSALPSATPWSLSALSRCGGGSPTAAKQSERATAPRSIDAPERRGGGKACG